jgi:hypothetical protein
MFKWADKFSIKVHVGIGVLFLLFGIVTTTLILLDVGKGANNEGILLVPLFAIFGGSVILWRAKEWFDRGDEEV